MSLFPRRALSGLLFAASVMTMPALHADEMDDQINERPSAMAMFGDAIIARPILFAGTLGGTALFVATLPFTALGGNVEEAADTLVVGMAKSTFTRCLGCSATQDAWNGKPVTEEKPSK